MIGEGVYRPAIQQITNKRIHTRAGIQGQAGGGGRPRPAQGVRGARARLRHALRRLPGGQGHRGRHRGLLEAGPLTFELDDFGWGLICFGFGWMVGNETKGKAASKLNEPHRTSCLSFLYLLVLRVRSFRLCSRQDPKTPASLFLIFSFGWCVALSSFLRRLVHLSLRLHTHSPTHTAMYYNTMQRFTRSHACISIPYSPPPQKRISTTAIS